MKICKTQLRDGYRLLRHKTTTNQSQGLLAKCFSILKTEWLTLHEVDTAGLDVPEECKVISSTSVFSLTEDEWTALKRSKYISFILLH